MADHLKTRQKLCQETDQFEYQTVRFSDRWLFECQTILAFRWWMLQFFYSYYTLTLLSLTIWARKSQSSSNPHLSYFYLPAVQMWQEECGAQAIPITQALWLFNPNVLWKEIEIWRSGLRFTKLYHLNFISQSFHKKLASQILTASTLVNSTVGMVGALLLQRCSESNT
jgi:hypothetical protein